MGQSEIYEQASEKLEKLLRIEMNKKQVERVSKYHGDQISSYIQQESKNKLPQCTQEGEQVYAMMDGSMILTRKAEESEETAGWKEVKLARLFSSKSMYNVNKNRNWIKDSFYVSHLGKHSDFLDKLSPYTDSYDNDLIFINDGATWIWNWIESNYPSAVHILDYYHAVEHLSKFVNSYFRGTDKKNAWKDQQIDLLWEDRIQEVINNIASLKCCSKSQKTAQQKLLTYYQNNQGRMLYGSYRKKGYLVGSAPIEAAHRTVIQKRMKLSGQRWTKEGAQNILDLRTTFLNGQWDIVIQSVKGKLAA